MTMKIVAPMAAAIPTPLRIASIVVIFYPFKIITANIAAPTVRAIGKADIQAASSWSITSNRSWSTGLKSGRRTS
jgi:hypothetical protein